MKYEAREVMPPGGTSEELCIQHVRKPRKRMPVGGVSRRESPTYAFDGEATKHERVLGDVERVVVLNESVLYDRPEEKHRKPGQEGGHKKGG